jgi:hypothetical protein
VIQGLSRTLARQRPLLVIEVTHPPIGTIGSLEELRRLLPENYSFLVFEDSRERAITGRYRLEPLHRLSRDGLYDMLVAYPNEREPLIRRERPAHRVVASH